MRAISWRKMYRLTKPVASLPQLTGEVVAMSSYDSVTHFSPLTNLMHDLGVFFGKMMVKAWASRVVLVPLHSNAQGSIKVKGVYFHCCNLEPQPLLILLLATSGAKHDAFFGAKEFFRCHNFRQSAVNGI
jgi:hypothetical protein